MLQTVLQCPIKTAKEWLKLLKNSFLIPRTCQEKFAVERDAAERGNKGHKNVDIILV